MIINKQLEGMNDALLSLLCRKPVKSTASLRQQHDLMQLCMSVCVMYRGTRAVDAVAAMEAAPPRRPFGPPPVLRPTGSSAAGGGGMPMGAELQQAILRRREQLKSVPDPSAATGSSQNGSSIPLPRGSQGASNGAAAAAAPHAGVGTSRGGGGGGGNGGCGGGVQLVRGLEQFKPFQATEDATGPAGEVDGETGSKTEFMQTSLSGRSHAT